MVVDVIKLKEEVIREFYAFLKEMRKGHEADYTHILDLINYIDVHEEISMNNSIYEHLLYYVGNIY